MARARRTLWPAATSRSMARRAACVALVRLWAVRPFWPSASVAAVAANAAGAASTSSAARDARKRLTFMTWVRPPWRAHAGHDVRAQGCAFSCIRAAAALLRRLRVVHLVTPPFAPHALDRLRASVPLLADAGLDVRWLAVAGDERADAAARAVGDALRGGEPGPPEDEQAWRERGAA